ncbi:hypothetical protein [Streptomyces natalensis]|uniref:hypothetical protein n=1 Tax=Streptomyces natalensis TaxID=68242 RepID=UPI0012FE8E4F|nr:hypothetical protein [Streptomyces natalensis]
MLHLEVGLQQHPPCIGGGELGVHDAVGLVRVEVHPDTLPWDRRDDFYRTDPEHIEDDARPIYSPTDVLCRLPNTPQEQGLLWRIDEQWEPGGCDDEYCRYHAN